MQLLKLELKGTRISSSCNIEFNEAKDKGANARALADANMKIGTQTDTIESLQQRIARLEAKLLKDDEEPVAHRGPGRPRKEAAA